VQRRRQAEHDAGADREQRRVDHRPPVGGELQVRDGVAYGVRQDPVESNTERRAGQREH
jgi:hypothetical protein